MSTVLEQAEQRLAALPTDEQASRRELLGRVAEVVIEKPLDELASLVDEFVDERIDAEDSTSWSLAEARKRNVERLLEDQARLVKQAIRGSIVREGMNVSRQRLHQLVAQRRLVAIQIQDGAPSLYPFWQFASGMPVQPIGDLPRLLEAARQAGMDEIELHFFMVTPNERLDGRAPYQLIAEGEFDRVIAVLASSGFGPF
jgi:hypothetical protein